MQGDPNKKQPSTNARKGRLSMKRLLILLSVGTLLSSCSASVPALAEPSIQMSGSSNNALAAKNYGYPTILSIVEPNIRLHKQQRIALKKSMNQKRIARAVKKVKKYAGITWYVFSGATPAGWDCSGLVRWTYEQAGITLEHSATKQSRSGKTVKEPMVGDIVIFHYGKRKDAFHSGIYIGNGNMIHSYRQGMRTVIQPVKQVVKQNRGSRVTYVRVLELPSSNETNS